MWAATEMERFEEVNPELARGEEGKSFANVIWQKKGKSVFVNQKFKKGVVTEKMKKKLLDREVPHEQIPVEQIPFLF